MLYAQYNQGIQISFAGMNVTVQATTDKKGVRYWVGKPDEVAVALIPCRMPSKAPIGAKQPPVYVLTSSTRPSAATPASDGHSRPQSI